MKPDFRQLRSRLRRESPSPLRRRLERLSGPSRQSPALPSPRGRLNLEQHLGGRWRNRTGGRLLVVERSYPLKMRRGPLPLGDLWRPRSGSVARLAGDAALAHFRPENTLFMDTETTGLEGGAGTYVFLIGVGFFLPGEFRTRQFFLTDLPSERAFLEEVAETVKRGAFRYLVTFNGKAYDLNLVANRSVLTGLEHPFGHLAHLDLLHPCRALWKEELENCRLGTLEEKILGLERRRDVPSGEIPRLYFDYLRGGSAALLPEVLEHNRLDLLSLVTLLTVAALALESPDPVLAVHPLAAAHLLRRRGASASAAALLEQALSRGAWPAQRAQLLLELALCRKEMGEREEVLSLCRRLILEASPPPLRAFEEAAKVLEHHHKKTGEALSLVEQALELSPGDPGFLQRQHRLQCRLQGKRWY